MLCGRQSIEVFSSKRDWAALGVGAGIVGTTDRRWTAAAGRVGFRLPECAEGDPLYTKLRQHPWGPWLAWSGNRGGHYDSCKLHLRAYVLPLLVPTAVARGG